MRVTRAVAFFLLAAWFGGCGNPPDTALRQQTHAAVREAQTHFTYKGKPIPPFFLADLYGGPGANDFWLRPMGSRISRVAVEGLFSTRDGSYAGSRIDDRRDQGGFVSLDLPPDESRGPGRAGYLGYRFVGTSPSGVTVLEYVGNTGGSGTVPGILFVRFEMEMVGATKDSKRQRLVMSFLGEDSWGDRVYRDVKLNGNSLWLGPTRTHMPGHKGLAEPERTILLE